MAIENTAITITGEYRPMEDLSKWVQAIFFISILVSIASILSAWMQAHVLTDVLHGGSITLAQATSNDNREQAVGIVQSITMVAGVIIFLCWVYRANKNLHAFSSPPMRFTPGWAVGWFFVPIMWLFRPYQAVNEISKNSNPDFVSGENALKNVKSSPIVAGWWAFFLLSNYVGWFTIALLFGNNTVEDFLNSTYAGIALDAVDIIGFILTIFMVRQISRAQHERYLNTVEKIKQEV